jgi:photosystem II stability/assembly factor-like uncharacterized protein
VPSPPQFNAIDCQPSNANWCCAVGEADNDSPAPGARIHCTQDGGNTWTQTFFQAGTSSSGYSLMEIRYATDNDVWAVGGELGSLYPSAWFLYSGDGGNTWAHGVTPIVRRLGCLPPTGVRYSLLRVCVCARRRATTRWACRSWIPRTRLLP